MLALLVVGALSACPVADIIESHILQLPTEDEISEAYPMKARAAGQEGHVGLSCNVDAKGVLSACRIDKEEPAGWDFGAAAVAIFNRIIVAPRTECGKPTAGVFHTGFRFKTSGTVEPEKSVAVLPAPSAEALALAQRLINAEHLPEQMASYTITLQQATLQDPKAPSELRLAAYEIAKTIVDRDREKILQGVAVYCAQNASLDDLRAWVSFVESPTGRRFRELGVKQSSQGWWAAYGAQSAEARTLFCAKTRTCEAVTPAP